MAQYAIRDETQVYARWGKKSYFLCPIIRTVICFESSVENKKCSFNSSNTCQQKCKINEYIRNNLKINVGSLLC